MNMKLNYVALLTVALAAGSCTPNSISYQECDGYAFKDLPHDMECYSDCDGNSYDFAFGLNWSGRISDSRTKKYGK